LLVRDNEAIRSEASKIVCPEFRGSQAAAIIRRVNVLRDAWMIAANRGKFSPYTTGQELQELPHLKALRDWTEKRFDGKRRHS